MATAYKMDNRVADKLHSEIDNKNRRFRDNTKIIYKDIKDKIMYNKK